MARGREGQREDGACWLCFLGMSKLQTGHAVCLELQTGDAVCPERAWLRTSPEQQVGSCWVEASERGRVRRVLYWGEGLADLGAPALC